MTIAEEISDDAAAVRTEDAPIRDDGAGDRSEPAAERSEPAAERSEPAAERSSDADGSSDTADERGDAAPDSSEPAPVHSPTAEIRTPTVDIDGMAAAIAGVLIDQTWTIRDPIDRYAALQDRRAVLLRAAQLVHEESTAEVLMMRNRRLTWPEIASLITKRVHKISEATVRAYVSLAQTRSAATG